jgi:hypothetical protein
MPTEPKSRSKTSRADDARGELLTPWLMAVAIGLAALVLLGSIERNMENRDAVAVSGPSQQQVGALCRPRGGAAHPADCH